MFPGERTSVVTKYAGRTTRDCLKVVSAFFENVNRHRTEGCQSREGEDLKNLMLEFRPRPTQDVPVACLWSRWSAPGETELLSFAAIADVPPAEV